MPTDAHQTYDITSILTKITNENNKTLVIKSHDNFVQSEYFY